MKLIILGNGFDLHHGLSTSFSNFRNHLLNSKNESDVLLCKNIDKILSNQNLTVDKHLLWNDYERAFGQVFSKSLNVSLNGVKIYDLTEQFVENFYEYLKKENEKKINILNPKIKEIFNDADCILTFNYTDTYKSYLPSDKNIEIFHIHGKLELQDLPIIGYYYPKILRNTSLDYMERYKGFGFHKPALAFKQNEIEFEKRLAIFQRNWKNKFSEIISIGYSYGESDSHIYEILNTIILPQINIQRVPKSKADEIPIINFKLFKYNEDEFNKTVHKIRTEFIQRHKRNSTLDITGAGTFKAEKKDILKFSSIEY